MPTIVATMSMIDGVLPEVIRGYYGWCGLLNQLLPTTAVGDLVIRVSPTTCKPLYREDLLTADLHEGMRVLDLGTGSGIIAVAAAKRGCQVVATDVSPAALADAAANAERNNVSDRITVVESDCFDAVQGRFDLVCSHLPYLEFDTPTNADSRWAASGSLADRVVAGAADHLTDEGELRLLWPAKGSDKIHELGAAAGLTVTREQPWRPGDRGMVLRRALYLNFGFSPTCYSLSKTPTAVA